MSARNISTQQIRQFGTDNALRLSIKIFYIRLAPLFQKISPLLMKSSKIAPHLINTKLVAITPKFRRRDLGP